MKMNLSKQMQEIHLRFRLKVMIFDKIFLMLLMKMLVRNAVESVALEKVAIFLQARKN